MTWLIIFMDVDLSINPICKHLEDLSNIYC